MGWLERGPVDGLNGEGSCLNTGARKLPKYGATQAQKHIIQAYCEAAAHISKNNPVVSNLLLPKLSYFLHLLVDSPSALAYLSARKAKPPDMQVKNSCGTHGLAGKALPHWPFKVHEPVVEEGGRERYGVTITSCDVGI